MPISITPHGDDVFKRLFGSLGSEKILKSLLESVLETEINQIELDLKQEYFSEDIEGRKNILDIRVIFEDGSQAYIEMQNAKKKNIGKRSLFYWCRVYSHQAKKGDTNLDGLKKTIGIWILKDGIYFTEEKDYHTVWKIRRENGESSKYFEDFEMHILELQKLREFGTIKPRKLDFWMWFIDYTSREMVELAERSVEEIREALKKLRELEADPIVSEIAFKEQLEEMDYNAEISSAKQEGIEQGIEQGENKKQREIAKNLKLMGMDKETIMKATGLSEEEIEEL